MKKARNVATASVTEANGALQVARRATIARALALAKACSVKAPRALVGGQAAGHPLVEGGMAVATVEQDMATFHSRTAAHSHQRGGEKKPNMAPKTLYRGECHPQQASQLGGYVSSGRELDGRNGPHKGTEAKDADSCVKPHQPAVVASEQVTLAKQRERRVAGEGEEFTPEWCRSVDAWCRQACCKFRQRVASEVVRSAWRLSWLHEGSACRREELAALAAFGDIPDLLEILGSMCEITIVVAEYVDKTESEAHDASESGSQRKIKERDIYEGQSRTSIKTEGPKTENKKPTMLENTNGKEETTSGASEGGVQQRVDHEEFTGPIAVDDSTPERKTSYNSKTSDDNGGIKGASGLSQGPRHRKSFSQSEFLPLHCEEPGDETQSNEEKREQNRGLTLRPSFATVFSVCNTVANDRQQDRNNPNSAKANPGKGGTSGIKYTRQPVAGAALRGSITLNPSSLEALLGMSPLSAFVLQRGRIETLESFSYRMGPPHDFGAQGPTSNSHCTVHIRDTGMSRLFDQPVSTKSDTVDSKSESKPPFPEVCLSEKERNGLGAVVQYLILPRIRLSSPKSVVGSERTLSLRLVSPKGSSIGSGEAMRGDSMMRSLSRLSPCLRRFLEAPVFRWAGRDDGCRCLFSCPAVNFGAATLAYAHSHQKESGREARTCTVKGAGESMFSRGPSEDADKTHKSHDATKLLRSRHNANKDQQCEPSQRVAQGNASSETAGNSRTLVEPSEGTDGLAIGAVDSQPRLSLRGSEASIAVGYPAPSVARVSQMFFGSKRREATMTTLEATPGQGYGAAGLMHTESVGVVPTKDLFAASTTQCRPAFWLSKEELARASAGLMLDKPLCHNCGRRSLRRLETTGLLLPPREYRADVLPGCRCESISRHTCIPVRDHKRRLHLLQSTDSGISRKGRFADWRCRSGVTLCDPCLRILRSSEVPLQPLCTGNLVLHA